MNTRQEIAADARHRLAVIDLDGTLLTPAGVVSPRTQAAVHALRQAGVHVLIATGRSHRESRPVLRQIEHNAFAAFVCGAVVLDLATDAVLLQHKPDPDTCRRLAAVFESAGFACLALQDFAATGVDYLVTGSIPLHSATSEWIERAKLNMATAPSLANVDHAHTLRVGIIGRDLDIAPLHERINWEFGSSVVTHSMRIPTYGLEVLEVFHPHASKWLAAVSVAARLNLTPEQIVAIGDDMNDLEMITHAGLGVAMGNARAVVKEAADIVINGHAEDGLAEFLERWTHAIKEDERKQPR